jgi:hypothetical protein
LKEDGCFCERYKERFSISTDEFSGCGSKWYGLVQTCSSSFELNLCFLC